MAVASYTHARSVVEYSESPLYHYEYSSISQSFARLLASCNGDVGVFDKAAKVHVNRFRPQSYVVRTHVDAFPVFKPFSPTLEGRSHVYKPNCTVAGNKPVEIGYNISCLNQGFNDKWSVPLDIRRVETGKTSLEVGVEQLEEFLRENPDLFVVNSADSGYGAPTFLARLYEQENLINIVRLKNRNVWDYAPKGNTGGAGRIYGEEYALRLPDEKSSRKHPKTKEIVPQKRSIFEKSCAEEIKYTETTTKGKLVRVEILRYNNMAIRSKKGVYMKDKPFDLLVVQHFDAETSKRLHKKPIYLSIFSKNKATITSRDAYGEHYQHRYDIEPHNRFVKRQLLLDKFQTPIQAHFDLWLRVIQLAEWLLFSAADEVESKPKKWQSYNDPKKQERLTNAQTRKSCESLFLSFDQTPFLPQISKKGKGRKLGTRFEKRMTFPIVVKRSQNMKKKMIPELKI